MHVPLLARTCSPTYFEISDLKGATKSATYYLNGLLFFKEINVNFETIGYAKQRKFEVYFKIIFS
jgi:hypothetical protein